MKKSACEIRSVESAGSKVSGRLTEAVHTRQISSVPSTPGEQPRHVSRMKSSRSVKNCTTHTEQKTAVATASVATSGKSRARAARVYSQVAESVSALNIGSTISADAVKPFTRTRMHVCSIITGAEIAAKRATIRRRLGLIRSAR